MITGTRTDIHQTLALMVCSRKAGQNKEHEDLIQALVQKQERSKKNRAAEERDWQKCVSAAKRHMRSHLTAMARKRRSGKPRRYTSNKVDIAGVSAEKGDWRAYALAKLEAAKRRSKKKGWPFDLTLEWMLAEIQAGSCPYTYLSYKPEGYYQPSIDRIDSSKGYVITNSQITSWFYNKLKMRSANGEAASKVDNLVEDLYRGWLAKTGSNYYYR